MVFALRRESDHRAAVEKIADQLVVAADMRPKRFRTKWQRAIYEGPTARKDAETAERDRWIQLLANLLRSTDTPMGKLIRENPSNIQLLGGGRRAGTLRSRVRSVQKFLGWLIASHGISFPVHWRQLTEYLQVRYSETCVRGSLKLVHSSYIFLQEVAGVQDKLTDSAMYAVSLKELMSQASPGRPPVVVPACSPAGTALGQFLNDAEEKTLLDKGNRLTTQQPSDRGRNGQTNAPPSPLCPTGGAKGL